MSKEAKKFERDVLNAAKWRLGLHSERLDIEIELTDVSIQKETFEIVDGEFQNKLIPATEDDVKPDAQLYIEPTLNVIGRNVVPPIILKITRDMNIELEDSKAEEVTITPEEETKFKERGPLIKRVMEAVIAILVAEAIMFGIRYALGFL